jgi:hypothetical protein
VRLVCCRYREQAIEALRKLGPTFDDASLQYMAPVHWNHINLTGDHHGPFFCSIHAWSLLR